MTGGVSGMVVAVVCCFNKQGMHEDEFYSYYSSNRTYGPVLEDTVSRDTVMDELTVRDGEGFNYGLVREVQSWDVHPPVYYFILHSVCSMMPGVFSMWQGLWINLACLLISLILMVRLGDKLLPAPSVMTVCLGTLAWGISAATLTGVVFIRMYMLLTVWILAVTLLHLGKSRRRRALRLRAWRLVPVVEGRQRRSRQADRQRIRLSIPPTTRLLGGALRRERVRRGMRRRGRADQGRLQRGVLQGRRPLRRRPAHGARRAALLRGAAA